MKNLLNINQVQLYIANGDLYITSGDKVVKAIESVVVDNATDKLGANEGVYAESCGGYAGQIHTAYFLDYDGDRVFYASNLDPYECDCEECELKGYDASECERKNWSEIDYMNEVYDGEKLYLLEFYALSKKIKSDKLDKVIEVLESIVDKEELQEEFTPSEWDKYMMMCNALSA